MLVVATVVVAAVVVLVVAVVVSIVGTAGVDCLSEVFRFSAKAAAVN